MKKSILILMTITILLSSILSCTGCAGEKNSLVGEWSSNHSDGSSATIIFEEGTEGLTGEISIVDTESSKWIKKTFTVNAMDEKNFTMTLLMDDGTVEKTFYVASKDTLYIFGIEFTNPKKNVKTTRTDTYVVDGEITPIISDVFFGMNLTHIKNSYFGKQYCSSNAANQFNAKVWGISSAEGIGEFLFDTTGKMNCVRLRISDPNDSSKSEVLKSEIIEMNNKKYGNYKTRACNDYHAHNEDYVWTSGNMLIILCDYSDMMRDIELRYELS